MEEIEGGGEKLYLSMVKFKIHSTYILHISHHMLCFHCLFVLSPCFSYFLGDSDSSRHCTLSMFFFLSVIRAKISGEKIVSPSNSSSPYMKMIQYEIKMIKVRPLGSRYRRGWGVIFSLLFCDLFLMRVLTRLLGQYEHLHLMHLQPCKMSEMQFTAHLQREEEEIIPFDCMLFCVLISQR